MCKLSRRAFLHKRKTSVFSSLKSVRHATMPKDNMGSGSLPLFDRSSSYFSAIEEESMNAYTFTASLSFAL